MSIARERVTETGDRGRLLVLLLYLGVLALLILAPYDFDTPRDVWPGVYQDLDRYEAEPSDLAVDLVKSLAHAVLFLPLAPLLAWKYGLRMRRLFSASVLLVVVGLSAGSELLQLSVSRGTSASDFIMNLVGYAAGAGVLGLYRKSPRLRALAALFLRPEFLAAFLGVLLLSLYLSLRPDEGTFLGPGGLRSWSLDQPLLVGNERTGSRPWLGTIERIAIRDHVVPANPPGGVDGRSAVIYEFQPEHFVLDEEGRVREIRSPGAPKLQVEGPGRVMPAAGGIELQEETTLRAHGAPWRHLLESIRNSDEFSLEVRFRPGSLEQFGPARIVSSSWDIRSRNFTLGQSGATLELRFRTPISGPNGTRARLRVKECLATDRVTDVLITYRKSVLKLHLDGEELASFRANGKAWFCVRFFGSPPTRRLALGLGLVWWAHCVIPLWLLLKRRRLPFPWNAVVAGITALALLAGVAAFSG